MPTRQQVVGVCQALNSHSTGTSYTTRGYLLTLAGAGSRTAVASCNDRAVDVDPEQFVGHILTSVSSSLGLTRLARFEEPLRRPLPSSALRNPSSSRE